MGVGRRRAGGARRTLVLDQVPIEKLVAALTGTDTTFQQTILSSLAGQAAKAAPSFASRES